MPRSSASRRPAAGAWLLRDLGSKNGTFVRIGVTLLKPGNELIIGAARFRFEAGTVPPALTAAPSGQGTQAFTGSVAAVFPSLVEIGPNGPFQRFRLVGTEVWIGREPGRGIVRGEDVLVNPRHACLTRDARGEWYIKNNGSLNGLWFRITEPIPLGQSCHFRLGEQRFYFRVL